MIHHSMLNSSVKRGLKRVLELVHISRRIYCTPNFVFFSIADGLFILAAKTGKGIADILRKKAKSSQLVFPHSRASWAPAKMGKLKKN